MFTSKDAQETSLADERGSPHGNGLFIFSKNFLAGKKEKCKGHASVSTEGGIDLVEIA